jgi:hypothetical protein
MIEPMINNTRVLTQGVTRYGDWFTLTLLRGYKHNLLEIGPKVWAYIPMELDFTHELLPPEFCSNPVRTHERLQAAWDVCCRVSRKRLLEFLTTGKHD